MKKLTLISALAIVVLSGCIKNLIDYPLPGKPKPPVVTPKPDTIADNSTVKIQLTNLTDTLLADNDIIVFNHTASTKYVPGEDAPYFGGAGIVSLAALSSDNQTLSIDYTPYKSGMIIGFVVSAKNDGNYSLKSLLATIPADIHIWLRDKLKADSVDLKITNYNFSVLKSDTNSYGRNRFTIRLAN